MSEDILTLVKTSKYRDDYGREKTREDKRTVFCKVSSISMREYFEAARTGLNPRYRFSVFPGDYEDETVVEYKGKPYAVYRTYQKSDDTMEIYTKTEGGVV